MTVVAIHQPNYLPWMGFFSKALESDVFVIYDNVQFEKGGYTNRVQIKSSQGVQWLTQPVASRGRAFQQIRDVEFADPDWRRKHLLFLRSSYGRAPHFQRYIGPLSGLLRARDTSLLACNERLIGWVFAALELQPRLVRASDLVGDVSDPTQRLIRLVKSVGGDTYLSGAGGFNYQNLAEFERVGIRVLRSRFTVRAYAQQWGTFTPGLSIVDLLFNCGPTSRAYLESSASGLAESVAAGAARP
jgi:hypothetical protein